MPCPEKIISKDVFYKENLNIVNVQSNNYQFKYVDGNDTFISTYIFTLPYIIQDETKVFLPEYKQTVINNYISYPINITIFTYSEINLDNIYISDN